jgi:hypothetical protein
MEDVDYFDFCTEDADYRRLHSFQVTQNVV